MVTAAERLGELALRCDGNVLSSPMTYNLSDGLQLIRQGRDLIFYISRARGHAEKHPGLHQPLRHLPGHRPGATGDQRCRSKRPRL
jgi:hypothetical protein